MKIRRDKIMLAIAGSLVGIIALALTWLGNPGNMGFCIACFVRDIAGSLGLHQAKVVQYMRPEIIGLVLGSFLISSVSGEFKARGGSAFMTRMIIGFFVMVGALAFLGCPLRMVIRLAGGDLNALIAFAGFAAGTGVGVLFLNIGFSLGRYHRQSKGEGLVFPSIQILLFVLLVAFPSILAFSAKGPGSMHAPIVASLAAGLVVGILAQRTRLCMVGGLRDTTLFGDWTLLCGAVFMFVVMLAVNLITGNFKLGFSGQPVAHSDHLWNFLGMMLVGLGSVLAGGCPLRQLILSGEGDSDAAVTVVGMFIGAAVSHNLGLSGVSGSGVPAAGRVAVVIGLLVCMVLGVARKEKN